MLQSNPELPSLAERSHPITESPVLLADGSSVSALELANRFYESPYGQSMRDQPLRYSTRYGYDRDSMLHDLGHDLCPLGHQYELAFHLGEIIDQEQANQTLYGGIDEYELGIVTLACLLHDIGESTYPELERQGYICVGDIPAGLKTDNDRANESAIRQYFYKEFLDDVDELVIERIEAIISHKDDSHLHDLFEAAHVKQTFETANYAHHRLARTIWHRNGEVFDISSLDGARHSGLLGIARVSVTRSLPEIEKFRHFSAIDDTLTTSIDLREPKHQLLN